MRMMGNVTGVSRVKTIGCALYVSPGVPLHVPVSGKVNCGVMGGERSPCSSAIIRILSGTHSETEPIATCTPSVNWEPETVASVTERVSLPCVHATGAAPICVEGSVDEVVELAEDDASASVDDGVESAVAGGGVLVAKIPASGPSAELTTYVPPPL